MWPTAPGNAVSAACLYLELFDLPEAVSVWPTAPGVAVQAHPNTKITFGKKYHFLFLLLFDPKAFKT